MPFSVRAPCPPEGARVMYCLSKNDIFIFQYTFHYYLLNNFLKFTMCKFQYSAKNLLFCPANLLLVQQENKFYVFYSSFQSIVPYYVPPLGDRGLIQLFATFRMSQKIFISGKIFFEINYTGINISLT